LLTNAMMFKLAESDEVDCLDERQLTEETRFVELRSMFRSMFLWPGLLAQCDDHRVRVKLTPTTKPAAKRTTTQPATESDSQSSCSSVSSNGSTRGRRSKKRVFPIPIDNFVRIRRLQTELFFTKPSFDYVGFLEQQSPPL